MTELQNHLVKKIKKIKDRHVINLCLEGAQVRANRKMQDPASVEMAYAFFTEVDKIHDDACIRDEQNWRDKIKYYFGV